MAEIFNLDLDEELISHLPDPDAWVVLRGEGFGSQLILDEFAAEVYAWQDHHIREHGQPATATVLSDEFDLDLADPETAIGDLIDRMRARYAKSVGRQRLKEIVSKYQDEPAELGKALLQEGKKLNDLLSKHGEMFGTGDFDRAERHYYEKVAQGPGASLGFPEIDDYFFGQRGLTMIIGPPKTWKSWFMLKGLHENVAQGKYPWLYSLELPAAESDMRLRCMISGIPWWKYLRNALTKEDWALIKEASELIDQTGVYKIPKPPQGERSIDQMVGRAGDAGADVIFIDQLQYVEVDGQSLGSWNETGKYWQVLDRARNLSDDIPICFAHQFNRSTMNADQMPSVQQAKGSASIEETATLALGLWANREMRQSSQCELGTLVSRNNNYLSWEVGIELSRGCNFEILGRVEE